MPGDCCARPWALGLIGRVEGSAVIFQPYGVRSSVRRHIFLVGTWLPGISYNWGWLPAHPLPSSSWGTWAKDLPLGPPGPLVWSSEEADARNHRDWEGESAAQASPLGTSPLALTSPLSFQKLANWSERVEFIFLPSKGVILVGVCIS